ncbi:OB-fold protein [Flavobacterium album]|nr:hypothetical protein [Flavobacterium album]
MMVLLFGSLSVVIGYYYLMTGGGRDLATENAEYSVASKNIVTEFESNSTTATKKYIDKAIEVEGVVTEVKDSVVILDKTVICKMQQKEGNLSLGAPVKIKGRCIGFDDLMEELQLDQCSVIK